MMSMRYRLKAPSTGRRPLRRGLASETAERSAMEGQLSARVTLDRGLYVVSTPLGNLGDVTLRALSVLRSVTRVYAEDTRRTKKLLNAFGITTPLISCHAHNEIRRAEQIVKRIDLGEVKNPHAESL